MIFIKTFDDLINAVEYSNKHKNSEIVIKKNRYKKIYYIVSWRK